MQLCWVKHIILHTYCCSTESNGDKHAANLSGQKDAWPVSGNAIIQVHENCNA